LQGFHIFTIRQLAELSEPEAEYLTGGYSGLADILTEARKAMDYFNREKEYALTVADIDVTVFVSVSRKTYKQTRKENAFKSAYVLFNEYMMCSTAERPSHPWKRIVFAQYIQEAAKWGQKTDLNDVTDADVFSYLVWSASSSYAEYDLLAGPKAIHFSWNSIPSKVRSELELCDKALTEVTFIPLENKYESLIGLNLTKLVAKHNAKIYLLDPKRNPPWALLTVDEAYRAKFTLGPIAWDNYEPGQSINNVPHGVVVLNSGSIPADCIIF